MDLKRAVQELRRGLREAGFGDAEVRAIFSRSGGLCHFCGAQIVWEMRRRHEGSVPDGAWEIDHYDGNPENDGAENLNAACFWCNRAKMRELVDGDDFVRSEYLRTARDAYTASPGFAGRQRDIMKALRGEE